GWRWRWIWLLGLGTLPAAAVGLPMKHFIEESFGSMTTVGCCFLVTGTFLFLGSSVRGALRTEEELDATDALTIGAFQALALMPGVSRSGSTISAGLFRRLRTDVAARYSFLLGIPAIAGAELGEAKALLALGPGARTPLAVGIVVSGVTGFAAIWGLLRIVQARRLHYFAYYTWALGVLVLVGATFFDL
ncbi:MAG: undecaprenyl-diphosphate phosphatase, partial [Candidatus Binatia bacterium]